MLTSSSFTYQRSYNQRFNDGSNSSSNRNGNFRIFQALCVLSLLLILSVNLTYNRLKHQRNYCHVRDNDTSPEKSAYLISSIKHFYNLLFPITSFSKSRNSVLKSNKTAAWTFHVDFSLSVTNESLPDLKATSPYNFNGYRVYNISPFTFTALPNVSRHLEEVEALRSFLTPKGKGQLTSKHAADIMKQLFGVTPTTRVLARNDTLKYKFVYILGLIMTKPANFKRRENIRKTWAKQRHWILPGEQTDSKTNDGVTTRENGLNQVFVFNPIFLVGSYVLTSQQQENITGHLEEECEKYRDILRATYVDSYGNLTYKTVSGLLFSWATIKTYGNQFKIFDEKYVLKIDEDILPNLPRIVRRLGIRESYLRNSKSILRIRRESGTICSSYLNDNFTCDIEFSNKSMSFFHDRHNSQNPSELIIKKSGKNAADTGESFKYTKFPHVMGFVHTTMLPVRNPKHQNYASFDAFPHPVYFPYCSGPAYLIHFDELTLRRLLEKIPAVKFNPNEDFYTTGALTRAAGISVINYGYAEYFFRSFADTILNTENAKPYSFYVSRKDEDTYVETYDILRKKYPNDYF